MKITSLVALALCAGVPLLADAPSVSVYGILDTGIAHVERAQNFSDDFVVGTYPLLQKGMTTGATGMFNGGLSGTRVGIKASADLVNGWKAIATLESAINLGSGRISDATQSLAEAGGKSSSAASAVSGQLFARGAFAGLSHETYGTLTFGRQQNLMMDIMIPYDATGLAQLFTPDGFAGSFLGGGVTENSRVDNSIKYRVKVQDFTVSALYKVSGTKGPDATAATACNEITVEYNHGPFGVYAGYQNLRNGITYGLNANGSMVTVTTPTGTATVASQGTINGTVYNTTNLQFGAKYKIGSVLVCAGYQEIKFEDPSAGDAAYFSSIPLGSQYAYGQQINKYTVNAIGTAAGNPDKKQTMLHATAAWDVTSSFKLMGGYYHVGINDYSLNLPASSKGSQTNAYISLIADYALTKAFDVYAGLMNASASGNAINAATGWYPGGDDTTKNTTVGMGFRYKF